MLSSDRRSFLILGLGSALVAGCGFEPVQRAGSAAADLDGLIAVQVQQGLQHFQLREELQHLLGAPVGEPTYALNYSLAISSTGIAVTTVDGTTRANLSGVLSYQVARADGGVVFSDTVRNFASYSANAETYPTRIAAQDARKRLVLALAKAAADQISLTASDWHS